MLVANARRVYVDADSEPLVGALVVIVDGWIDRILTGEAAESAQRGADDVLDVSGLTVLPGFVDAHLHVTTRGAGRLHEEMGDTPAQAREKGVANLTNALGWGVTTVRDAGSWDDVVRDLRDAVDAGRLEGPRVLPAGAPLTASRGHLYWFGGEAEGVEAVGAFVRGRAALGMTHVKVMATGGWATSGSDPRLPQFSVDELRAAADAAHENGMHTMAHLSATEGVRRALAAGIDTFEHAMFQDPSGAWESADDVLEGLLRARAWIDPTPAWHYRTVQSPPAGRSAERLEALREARAARMEVYRRLVRAGHTHWLTGTDTGGTNPRDYFPLVAEIMVKDIGMSPRAVVKAATADGAAALGLEHETGALRPGMAADLVATEGDPLEDIAAMWRVRAVVARGRTADVPDHSVLDESVGGGPEGGEASGPPVR